MQQSSPLLHIPMLPNGPLQQNNKCWCDDPERLSPLSVMSAPVLPSSPWLEPGPSLRAMKGGGSLAPGNHPLCTRLLL